MQPRQLHRVLVDTAPTLSFQRQEPVADLQPYVAFYWQSQPTTELHTCALPNYAGLLSFNISQQPWYSVPLTATPRRFTDSQVFGHSTQTCYCTYPAGTELFGVTLQPGALSLLLQRPATELANYATTLTDHSSLADLERVLIEPTFAGRVAILEAHLRLRFGRTAPDYRYALVQAATSSMARSGPLGRLADQLSVTPKSLTRYFQQVVGLTPKRCAQLARFKQALTEYRQFGRAWDYEAAGYADFAHFARASYRLTGRRLSEL